MWKYNNSGKENIIKGKYYSSGNITVVERGILLKGIKGNITAVEILKMECGEKFDCNTGRPFRVGTDETLARNASHWESFSNLVESNLNQIVFTIF